MKTIKILLFSIIAFCFSSCIYWNNDDDIPSQESQYEPITQTRSFFENDIELQTSRPISDAGKIYIKDEYILINENEEGFHLYDNTNAESPEPIAYLKVKGATDLAIRGNTMYIHHLVDLVAIEYNFYTNSIENINRSPNVFPRLISPDGFQAEYFNVPENEVITGYQLKN